MKKKILITILSCVMILSLVACGGKENTKDDTTSSTNESTDVATTVTPIETETHADTNVTEPTIDEVVDNPLAFGDLYDYIPSPTPVDNIEGTLEELYNKHKVEHVANYVYEQANLSTVYDNIETCPFCRVDRHWFDDYSKATDAYPQYEEINSNREWIVKGNSVVYVHTLFSSKDVIWDEDIMGYKEYSPKLSENPYWYETYVNKDWYANQHMAYICYFACNYDIQPENVSFLIKWCPEDEPAHIFTTATAANMDVVMADRWIFYFDDFWNAKKNNKEGLHQIKLIFTEDQIAKIDAFAEKCAANRNNTN